MEGDAQATKETDFHGNFPGNFYAKSDDSFSSFHSWDLPKGVSHLLLHCHLLCSIVPYGPGLFSDMSQAVVSAGLWCWLFFFFLIGSFSTPAKMVLQLQLLIEAHTFPNRYLETHQWCRGSGGPCSARFRVQPCQSPWGLEPVRFVPRSNRSKPGARRLACWWWCSLCLHSVICPSAPSISWKGNHSSCYRDHKVTEKWTILCYKHLFFLILSSWLHVGEHSQRKGQNISSVYFSYSFPPFFVLNLQSLREFQEWKWQRDRVCMVHFLPLAHICQQCG